MQRSRLLLLLAALNVGGHTLLAQTAPPAAPPTPASQNDPRPIAHAALRRQPIVIDGKLDDAACAAAEPSIDFHQHAPHEGKPPTERTAGPIRFDAGAVYTSAR